MGVGLKVSCCVPHGKGLVRPRTEGGRRGESGEWKLEIGDWKRTEGDGEGTEVTGGQAGKSGQAGRTAGYSSPGGLGYAVQGARPDRTLLRHQTPASKESVLEDAPLSIWQPSPASQAGTPKTAASYELRATSCEFSDAEPARFSRVTVQIVTISDRPAESRLSAAKTQSRLAYLLPTPYLRASCLADCFPLR